jgi:hypothetical protein
MSTENMSTDEPVNNKPNYKIYNWHHRKALFDFQETKLFDDTLGKTPAIFEQCLATIDFATPHEKYEYLTKYSVEYETIYDRVSEFKLVKLKEGENTPINLDSIQIGTMHMEPIYDEKLVVASITLLILQREQRLWSYFTNNYIYANIYYKKKDTVRLSPDNSRCIVDCDNILKYVNRYIKYYIIDTVYETQNLVDTDIHRARKCIEKVFNRPNKTTGEPIYYYKLCFESVSDIAMILYNSPYPFIALDLTNAYNNVVYESIYPIMTHYLGENALCILRLCQAIKYKDPVLNINMKRNKGIPQGSPLSMDLFIIIMDWLCKQIINDIAAEYGLQHNIDYQIICYVDDIQVLLKTVQAQTRVSQILDTFDSVFTKYNFILNRKKCYKSRHIEIADCQLPEYGSSEKYLGIYLEKDADKYLKIVEQAIADKYHQNPDMQSLAIINSTLPKYKNKTCGERIVRALRGVFQYRLKPFAKSREELHKFFTDRGFTNIAEYIF